MHRCFATASWEGRALLSCFASSCAAHIKVPHLLSPFLPAGMIALQYHPPDTLPVCYCRPIGVITMQNPFDMFSIQDIIYSTRPDLIIETGTANGGSALLWASIMEMNNIPGRIVTMDVDEPAWEKDKGAWVGEVRNNPRESPLWKKYITFLKVRGCGVCVQGGGGSRGWGRVWGLLLVCIYLIPVLGHSVRKECQQRTSKKIFIRVYFTWGYIYCYYHTGAWVQGRTWSQVMTAEVLCNNTLGFLVGQRFYVTTH